MTGPVLSATWIMPTRGRPKSVARFLDAYIATKATSRVVVMIDECDPCCNEYQALFLLQKYTVGASNVVPLLTPRRSVGGHIACMADMLMDTDCTSIGLLGDDIVPRTEKWDVALADAAGFHGVAYARDLDVDERFANHPVIGVSLLREVGFLVLPGLRRLYIDTVWHDIGTKRGVLRFCPAVILEHLHFSNGKAEFDEVYRKPEADSDKAIYERWRDHAFPGL
jgi:hypothetical protein